MISLRILRITPDLYPYSWGGIAVDSYLLSKAQAEAGHSVTVITLRDSSTGSNHPEFEVHRLPGVRDAFGNPVMPAMFRYIRGNLDRFDVLHVHSQLFYSSLIAVWSRRSSEIPAVLTCHGVRSAALPFFMSDFYLRTASRALIARVQRVICYSMHDARLLHDLAHASLSRVQIVQNGVSLDTFRPSRFASAKEPVILWAGRMVRQKRLDLLLRSMRIVVDTVPSSRLYLLGDGPMLSGVKLDIERLGLGGHVNIMGEQPFERMPSIYNEAAVCVIPSSTEGMPRTLMEAAAMGVPIVATRLPQLGEFLGRGVVLFQPGSVTDLARQLTRILTDSSYAVRLGSEARKLAEQEFDLERTVSMTTECCEQLLSQFGGN